MRNRKTITLAILAGLVLALVAPIEAKSMQAQTTSRAKRNSVTVRRKQDLLLSGFQAPNNISPDESVLTQHNNSARTGVFPRETVLTPSKVRHLKRLYVRRVDGQIAAQPLFVKGVTIDGQTKDVLYVVTRKNFIYAFDVNNTDPNDPHNGQAWRSPIELTYTDPDNGVLKAEPLVGMDILDEKPEHTFLCRQTHGPVGITSTPVIDPVSQLMYVVFRVGAPIVPDVDKPNRAKGPRRDHHFIAAIDIQTGQERMRREITFTGFDPAAQLNRPGLLLLKGVVYVAFAANVCDNADPKYHGWVFAYSAPNLERLATFNTTPKTWGGGIWQSGSGLAADDTRGLVYAFTGDNHDPEFIAREQTGRDPFSLLTGQVDDLYHRTRTELGESILQFSLRDGRFTCARGYDNCVPEHFTAGNWYRLDTGKQVREETLPLTKEMLPNSNERKPMTGGDADLGSGGATVLQNGFIVGGGKQGRVYVLDPSNMRVARQGFQAFVNTWHLRGFQNTRACKADPAVDNPFDGTPCFVDERDYDMAQAYGPNIHGSLVVWQRLGVDFGYMYGMAEKDYLRAFKVFKSGRIEERPTMTTKGAGLRSPDGMPGAALSLSSNGDRDAVLWVSLAPDHDATNTIEPGILMAFDAMTFELLWEGDAIDKEFYLAKFVPPTIAGGKVFRGTFGQPATLRDQVSVGRGLSCTEPDPHTPDVWPSCGAVVVYGL